MCVEAMDTSSKKLRNSCLRKTMKPGSKLRWIRPRVFVEDGEVDEALKQCRGSALRTIRKYLGRAPRRPRLADLAQLLGGIGGKAKMESAREEGRVAACAHRQPSGAMAPENTTQYLMGNVYEDMATDDAQAVPRDTSADACSGSLSSPTVCAPQDCDEDGCLAFQQRDFEEAFELYWQPE